MKLEKFVFGLSSAVVLGTFLFLAHGTQGENTVGQNQPAGAVQSRQAVKAQLNDLTDGKKLVFGDEFNGSTLDSAKWATCYDWRRPSETGCTNHGNFEQQWYTGGNVKVADGQLILSAEKRTIDVAVQGQAKSFAYTSGMISSGRGSTEGSLRWAGVYGYYEARMKVQAGQGVWPAFWLLPADKEWPPEIDIMEFIGGKPGEILQTLHWPAEDGPQKSDGIVKGSADYSQDWHTYGVDWRADGIDWYIDGVKTRSYAGPHVPDEAMEIILNLAIGGLLPGNADATTPPQRELQVDYVRVYQTQDQMRPHQ